MILTTAPSGSVINPDDPLMDLVCSADGLMDRANFIIHLLR